MATDRMLLISPFPNVPLEDARVGYWERCARRRKAPRRYEVATRRRLHGVMATQVAAIRRARNLAPSLGTEVFVVDRFARRKSVWLWIFRPEGTIERVLHRSAEIEFTGRRAKGRRRLLQ
jgi:hypothetical protein